MKMQKSNKAEITIIDDTVPLNSYLAGLTGVNLNTIKVAGEDLTKDVMNVSIIDLPEWIKSGAKFELKMPLEDIKLLKNYFTNKV